MLIELSVKAFEGEGGGQVLAIGRDVTAQREATRRLVEAEAMYRTLVERIPDVVWRMTPDDRFAFMSPNVYAVTGVTAEALYRNRKAWLDRVHRDDLDVIAAKLERTRRTGEGYEIEYRFFRPDGKMIWLQSRVSASDGPDGRTLEGLTADITERRLLQDSLAQAQKLEAVGQLTGSIAHDFNNLLTVILSNATFLLDELQPADPRYTDAHEIEDAAKRASALTRQLLAFSRRQAVELVPVDVNAVIGSVQKMLRRLIEDNELTFSFAPGLGVVRADAGQLEQVVVNLIVNARDAMPNGGKIAVATEDIDVAADDPRRLPAGRYVRFTVRDTGIGMPPEVLGRIFEPFFTTKERGHGTGLGLATCYGIVRHLGGHIGATSEVGRGTELEVLLPESDVSDEPAPAPAPEASRGSETVLVVEDESAVRRGLARILRDRGYHVLLAGTGEEAVAIARGHAGRIDLVVTDVVLPGDCGPDVIARVRESRPEVRALMISGYSDHATLSRALAAGSAFLHKPFSATALASKVREALDARSEP